MYSCNVWVNLIFTIFTNRDPYQQPNSPHPQHAGVKEGQPPPPPPPLRTRPSAINSRLKPSDSSFGLHSPDNLPVGFNPQDDKVQVGFILCAFKVFRGYQVRVSRIIDLGKNSPKQAQTACFNTAIRVSKSTISLWDSTLKITKFNQVGFSFHVLKNFKHNFIFYNLDLIICEKKITE